MQFADKIPDFARSCTECGRRVPYKDLSMTSLKDRCLQMVYQYCYGSEKYLIEKERRKLEDHREIDREERAHKNQQLQRLAMKLLHLPEGQQQGGEGMPPNKRRKAVSEIVLPPEDFKKEKEKGKGKEKERKKEKRNEKVGKKIPLADLRVLPDTLIEDLQEYKKSRLEASRGGCVCCVPREHCTISNWYWQPAIRLQRLYEI